MVRASTSTSTPGSSDVAVLGGHTPAGTAAELARLEDRVVRFGLELVDAPDGAVGQVAADRWEAALLAVLAAREARPDAQSPAVVLADTGHPAYHRAARLLGLEVRTVPTDAAGRAQVGPMAHALDEHTVLAVVSAPSSLDGVVDPVAWIGTAAAAKGVPLHVDATSGGWLLAFAERLGRVVPPWTFASPGTATIALDLDEHAGGPTLLAFRDPLDRSRCGEPRPERSAVAIRAACERVGSLGHDDHLRVAGGTLRAVEALTSCVASLPGLRLLAPPETSTLVLATDDSCDVFTILEELRARGWYAATRPSRPGTPPGLRLTVDARAREHVEDCVTDLREATALARDRGPLVLPRRVLDHLARLGPARLDPARLDPGRLTAADVAVLLDALDLDPAGAEGSARFSALVDAAPAALREALAARHLELLHAPTR